MHQIWSIYARFERLSRISATVSISRNWLPANISNHIFHDLQNFNPTRSPTTGHTPLSTLTDSQKYRTVNQLTVSWSAVLCLFHFATFVLARSACCHSRPLYKYASAIHFCKTVNLVRTLCFLFCLIHQQLQIVELGSAWRALLVFQHELSQQFRPCGSQAKQSRSADAEWHRVVVSMAPTIGSRYNVFT